jgi:serine/threonine protein kinase
MDQEQVSTQVNKHSSTSTAKTVYDADEDPASGTPFIAMEYVPGRSLAEQLSDKGRLDPERVFAMADVLADALQAAHDAGIVHLALDVAAGAAAEYPPRNVSPSLPFEDSALYERSTTPGAS